mmetsp:Transcript_11532/g.18910  ORF Transcript_11532/g.18910 Transcript_11532/m.18910 type:complete len:216 (+) Transcript_11532:1069-1716(+)
MSSGLSSPVSVTTLAGSSLVTIWNSRNGKWVASSALPPLLVLVAVVAAAVPDVAVVFPVVCFPAAAGADACADAAQMAVSRCSSLRAMSGTTSSSPGQRPHKYSSASSTDRWMGTAAAHICGNASPSVRINSSTDSRRDASRNACRLLSDTLVAISVHSLVLMSMSRTLLSLLPSSLSLMLSFLLLLLFVVVVVVVVPVPPPAVVVGVLVGSSRG